MTVSASGLITGSPENKDVGDHTVTVKVEAVKIIHTYG